MTDLAARSLRVALTGRVHDDDPHIIAEMMHEIDVLRKRVDSLAKSFAEQASENEQLREVLTEAVRLFEHYGMLAQQLSNDPFAAGVWIERARDVLKLEGG